ncbi:E3 ubiquitin-protein ligase RNF115/126 [Spatholobus suberectus]|nr:E3 ubiquitin-protein ligase RNF115/126 [Spatholobus suberectus]
MDEYHCRAYPHMSASDFVSEIPFCHEDQHFNVEVEYTNMYVLNARKFHTVYNTAHHKFPNISKDEMMQETTIVSWLSQMGVPRDAHKFVVANVLECARGMANNRTHYEFLSMRVEVVITRASEDETSDEEEEEDDDDDDFEEEEEELEDEDHGLVPAAKSLVEGLETVEQEGSMRGRCAICFEDFLVGVRMPCLHMFHKNCIGDWLRKTIQKWAPLYTKTGLHDVETGQQENYEAMQGAVSPDEQHCLWTQEDHYYITA